MENPGRRDVLSSIAAFAALAAFTRNAAHAEESVGPKLDHSQLFAFDKLPVHESGNGGASRAVVHGTLATGEFAEVHETMLPAGQMPHPPHRHTHSEFLLIREGVLSEGQKGIIETGGVVFTASGVLHSLKNIGDTPANYFVVAVGIQKTIV